jgi:hypothetical protein
VDHGRSHIGVAQQFLHRTNVVPVLKQVASRTNAARMTARRCGYPAFEPGPFIAFCMTDSWR